MACIFIKSENANIILCGVNLPHAKFKDKNGKRYYMEFHRYCGPSFFTDANRYHITTDIPEEIWEQFGKWYEHKGKIKENK